MAVCRSVARRRVFNAAEEFDSAPSVVAVDVIPPTRDPTDCWTVELTLNRDGLPGSVTGILSEHDLTLRHAGPRGTHWHAVAVADN